MKQEERISRNPLNFGDMGNFLLRIAKHETSCEAARGDLGRIQFAAGNLMGQIYKDRANVWWDEITETLVCDDLAEVQEKLCPKYSKEQLCDFAQEIVKVLFGYFNIRECFDAIRLQEEYEGGAAK